MARLVEQDLRRRGYPVFLDVEDLQSGPFDNSLLKEIENATDVVIILTANCLDRCANEGDWVRQEIAHAIKCGKNIIPFMNSDFEFPSDPLPDDIAKFTSFHGVQFSHNEFSSSMGRLVSLLTGKRKLPKIPVALVVLVVLLLIGSFTLARLIPRDDSNSASLVSNGNSDPPSLPAEGKGAPQDQTEKNIEDSNDPVPKASGGETTNSPPQSIEKVPKEDPAIDYSALAAELKRALDSSTKTDLPDALHSAAAIAGTRPEEEIPRIVLTRIELICLRMALEGSWEAELDLEALQRVSAPPFNARIALLVLANEKLEVADLLIAEKRIDEANQMLNEGMALLDEGIENGSIACGLKKGSLLTRHLHFKYKNVDGLNLEGDPAAGLKLMEEAYKATRTKYLERKYFEPADYTLPFDDSFFEAQTALVIAQCWHHGIGTEVPAAYDPKGGFEGDRAAKKAIDYYRKVLELEKDNGEARAGLLEILIFRNENHWDDEMISLAKRGAELDDDFCMYRYAMYLWGKDRAKNGEEVRSLMGKMARPRRKYTDEARKWLEDHPPSG